MESDRARLRQLDKQLQRTFVRDFKSRLLNQDEVNIYLKAAKSNKRLEGVLQNHVTTVTYQRRDNVTKCAIMVDGEVRFMSEVVLYYKDKDNQRTGNNYAFKKALNS